MSGAYGLPVIEYPPATAARSRGDLKPGGCFAEPGGPGVYLLLERLKESRLPELAGDVTWDCLVLCAGLNEDDGDPEVDGTVREVREEWLLKHAVEP